MAFDPVTICNMALSHVGADNQIQSLEDAGVEAGQCNLWYDHSRRQTLGDFDWTFARRRVSLSLDSDAPPSLWTFRYQYPGNIIKVRGIQKLTNDSDAVPFVVETNDEGNVSTILTDMEDAIAIVTHNVTNVERFTYHFMDTLSHLIAYRIAYKITGKTSRKREMQQVYQALLATAPAKDADERTDKAPRDTDWIRGR